MRLAALLAAALAGGAAAEEPPPDRLAVGVTAVGGQLDWTFARRTRAELRYVTGESGAIRSNAVGLRGYRLIGSSATRPYAGAELAYVGAKGGGARAAGTAGGAFVGVERRIARRVALGADAGPYVFSMRDAATRVSDSTLEFVLNCSAMLFLF